MQASSQKKVVLTGGGTAGHVIPNLVLISVLQDSFPATEIAYLGSAQGMEHDFITQEFGNTVPFYNIATGKLRRYFSLQNIVDIFKVGIGFFQSVRVLQKLQPVLVFNKGGYVGVPVSLAAACLRIPIIIHESDASMGLANKIVRVFADLVLYSHPALLKTNFRRLGFMGRTIRKLLRKKHTIQSKFVQLPVRKELTEGKKAVALTDLQLSGQKPVILIMGGSQGSATVNQLVRLQLNDLLAEYDVIHVVGKGNLNTDISSYIETGYRQIEYIDTGIQHYYALADILVGRAGATALAEWTLFGKPAVLIPLASDKSRGEQALNAEYFIEHNSGIIVTETALKAEPTKLLTALAALLSDAPDSADTTQPHAANNGTSHKDAWEQTISQYREVFGNYLR